MHGDVIITTQMITLGKTSEEGDTMKHIKFIGNFVKGLFKMMFCRHSYKEIYKYRLPEHEEVVLEVGYECIHCRKRLTVQLDAEAQLKKKK